MLPGMRSEVGFHDGSSSRKLRSLHTDMSNLTRIGLMVVFAIPVADIAMDVWYLTQTRKFNFQAKKYSLPPNHAALLACWLIYRLAVVAISVFAIYRITVSP